jgi:glycerophosphoryl diester phosphodiesterase
MDAAERGHDAWEKREMTEQATETMKATKRPVCYAHRGARVRAPENTLRAFRLAFELGADAIECDVQRSRDGRLVIIHDGTVDRTTDGSGWVAEMSFAELRGLNAGRGERIPALEETLALARERDGGINLEVKGESVAEALETAEALLAAVRELEEEMRGRVLVSSFAHPAIALLKARLPWLRTGALFGDEWRGRDLLAPALAAGAKALHPGLRLVTPELVRRAHDAGLAVNVWTVNRPADIQRSIAWEVDGIFSDYPERVVAARG